MEEHVNTNDYLTDFGFIDENLQSKYGSTKVERDWSDDQWKDSKSYWGHAIEMGQLFISTEWAVPDGTPVTEITHFLDGVDYQISHGIQYYSVELETQLDSLRKENVF